MIAILAALAPFIPGMISFAGVIMKWFGASKEDLAAYEKMVQSNKDNGLMTVETYTRFKDFHAEMLAELEEKEKQENGKDTPGTSGS